ncbi:MAG: hypothetical protein R3C59_20080 [Planctomycetaceae bacterium]
MKKLIPAAVFAIMSSTVTFGQVGESAISAPDPPLAPQETGAKAPQDDDRSRGNQSEKKGSGVLDLLDPDEGVLRPPDLDDLRVPRPSTSGRARNLDPMRFQRWDHRFNSQYQSTIKPYLRWYMRPNPAEPGDRFLSRRYTSGFEGGYGYAGLPGYSYGYGYGQPGYGYGGYSGYGDQQYDSGCGPQGCGPHGSVDYVQHDYVQHGHMVSPAGYGPSTGSYGDGGYSYGGYSHGYGGYGDSDCGCGGYGYGYGYGGYGYPRSRYWRHLDYLYDRFGHLPLKDTQPRSTRPTNFNRTSPIDEEAPAPPRDDPGRVIQKTVWIARNPDSGSISMLFVEPPQAQAALFYKARAIMKNRVKLIALNWTGEAPDWATDVQLVNGTLRTRS